MGESQGSPRKLLLDLDSRGGRDLGGKGEVRGRPAASREIVAEKLMWAKMLGGWKLMWLVGDMKVGSRAQKGESRGGGAL